MALEKENQTSNLKTVLEGLTKTYLIHDSNNRIIAAYEAKTDAKPGEPCMLTRFAYRQGSGVSSQIRFNKEENAFWDPENNGWDDELSTSPLPSPLEDLDLP